MKESRLPMIGSLIIIVAFVYLTIVLVGHTVPLNPATWVMWSVLDIFLAYSMITAKNEGKWIMIGFATGATIIAIITITQSLSGKTTWTWGYKETFTAACFIAAFIARKISKSDDGRVITGTIAMYTAGVPTLIDAWRNPSIQDPWFWGICAIGCLITLIGSKKTFTGIFMPTCGTVFNGLIAALAMGIIR